MANEPGNSVQANRLPPVNPVNPNAPLDKKTEELANKYLTTVDKYMKSLKLSDMNIFKMMFNTIKADFKKSVISDFLQISKMTGVNMFARTEQLFEKQITLFEEMITELQKGQKVDTTSGEKSSTVLASIDESLREKNERDIREAQQNEVNQEETRREQASLWESLAEFFRNNGQRGDAVKAKLGMKNFDIGDLLDPDAARSTMYGLFNKLTSPLIGAVAALATQALGLLATGATPLVGGIAIGIWDAVNAGLKSIDWGVDKVPAMIAGFLAGSDRVVRSEMLTSFGTYKNVAKWGLIGAGIGSIFPVVGTLVGGLIGAAIGLILTFIGPETIAKFLQRSFDKLKQLSDVVFGTELYSEQDIKGRIDDLNRSTEAHKQEIAENFEKIKNLNIELQDAIARGDTDKANKLRAEIKHWTAINADIQKDIDANSRYMDAYEDDLRKEHMSRWEVLKEEFRDMVMMMTPDWVIHKGADFRKWLDDNKRMMVSRVYKIGDDIAKAFWELIDKISSAFSNMGDTIWNYIKNQLWDKMQGNSITEAIFEQMFGKANIAISPAAREPEEFSKVDSYINKTEKLFGDLYDSMPSLNLDMFSRAPSMDMSRTLEEQLQQKAAIGNVNISSPVIVKQDNSVNAPTNVKNTIIPSPYGTRSLFTRTMQGGGPGGGW